MTSIHPYQPQLHKLKDQANATYYYRLNLKEGEQKLYHFQSIHSSCFPNSVYKSSCADGPSAGLNYKPNQISIIFFTEN